MADDDAIILRAAAEGRSIRDIADERGLSEGAVTAILDREASMWFEGAHLRRELLFEMTRLDALARKYYGNAMTGEGDTNSGALYVKISERERLHARHERTGRGCRADHPSDCAATVQN